MQALAEQRKKEPSNIAAEAGFGVNQQEPGAVLSVHEVPALTIQELPSVVVQLFERAPQPLLADLQGQLGLWVRYLRRKPGRGLTVAYNAGPLNAARGVHDGAPERCVRVALEESGRG